MFPCKNGEAVKLVIILDKSQFISRASVRLKLQQNFMGFF